MRVREPSHVLLDPSSESLDSYVTQNSNNGNGRGCLLPWYYVSTLSQDGGIASANPHNAHISSHWKGDRALGPGVQGGDGSQPDSKERARTH